MFYKTNNNIIRVWAVNQYVDLNGNYTNVSYDNEVSIGEYYVKKISYTGNLNGSAPQRSIEFNYEARNDNIEQYIAGFIITTSKRLSSIET